MSKKNKYSFNEEAIEQEAIEQEEQEAIEQEEQEAIEQDTKKVPENFFTYVGAGQSPPPVINFMGKEEFVRGEGKVVTNTEVLHKLRNHPCFINGVVSQKELYQRDKEASVIAEKNQQRDKKMNVAFLKKHGDE